MTTPQHIYLIAVAIYVLLFLMFSRFFLWKRYAEARYWRVRPSVSIPSLVELSTTSQQLLPFFSILIPARNEAQVIEKTLKHMLKLNYPKNAYEVIVVTDEKESLDALRLQADILAKTLAFLNGEKHGLAGPQGNAERCLALHVLSELALTEYYAAEFKDHASLSPAELANYPRWLMRELISTLATELISSGGRLHIGRVYCLLRRAYPDSADVEIARIYPKYLCLALPIIAAYAKLSGDSHLRLLHTAIKYTAQAGHKVTQDILASFTNIVTQGMFSALREVLREDKVHDLLHNLYPYCFPTTQTIVARVLDERQETHPVLKHIDVPHDYDGLMPGRLLGVAVPSTKGRALNYALSRAVSRETTICGFYDAESRPQADVLLYVAYKKLTGNDHTKIWQGPVFQVRNFYEMGPFSKIASLYQAVAHDWYLPVVFRRLPFVGGTNLYVDYKLLMALGGYDHESLTEDLELGTRAYLSTGAWPDYLPYASSEQTPPSFLSFYRQRLRWGAGHLQVMDKIRRNQVGPVGRREQLLRQLSIKGPYEWIFYQSVTLLPPTMLFLYLTGNVDPSILPPFMRTMLNFLSLVYISFTFYAFFRYRSHLDQTSRPIAWYGHLGVAAELCFLPLAAFFFPVPYTSAMLLKVIGRSPTTWTKTPRTRE
ncbi:MAG: glycosyltransferase [Firmicutes bacterium]|nr:glycosyltransferase [Dethiobacter sp.]MBS3888845.1 glycosyltransferase [Bacillota bacterium]MBS4054950.1 glycosyltransferase [Thermaerobacter sp.]